jgi:hypothetical protein
MWLHFWIVGLMYKSPLSKLVVVSVWSGIQTLLPPSLCYIILMPNTTRSWILAFSFRLLPCFHKVLSQHRNGHDCEVYAIKLVQHFGYRWSCLTYTSYYQFGWMMDLVKNRRRSISMEFKQELRELHSVTNQMVLGMSKQIVLTDKYPPLCFIVVFCRLKFCKANEFMKHIKWNLRKCGKEKTIKLKIYKWKK